MIKQTEYRLIEARKQEIEKEMENPSQMVGGVKVYTVDLILYKRYVSFAENEDTLLFIASDSLEETDLIVNSLNFE